MSHIANAWIEEQMRVCVCRFCGARADECGGTCVSATKDAMSQVEPDVVTTDLPRLGSPHPLKSMKVKSTQVWKWPEWKAFADRLGINIERVTDCVVHLNYRDMARVSVTYIGEDTCPQPHDATAPSASSTEEQKPAHHPLSEDTTATGHD